MREEGRRERGKRGDNRREEKVEEVSKERGDAVPFFSNKHFL